MQSRGIKLEQAKKMLLNSFLFNLINKIEDQKSLSLINNQIDLWINNVN